MNRSVACFAAVLACASAIALASSPAAAAPAAAPAVSRVERGQLVLENIPAIPAALAERMNQYQNTRGAALRGWLPDGSGVLISTRFGDTAQVHVVRQPLGARTQITFFREPVGASAIHPQRQEFLFTKDTGGDEFDQIWRFDLASGRYDQLTEGRFIHRGVQWNRAGSQFAFYSNRRTGRDWDIYVAPAAAPREPRMVVSAGGFWVPGGFSPDDRKLMLVRVVSANESYLHILDLASGEVTPVNPSADKIAYRSAVWSADGQGLFLASDEGAEFQRLRHLDLATGRQTVLTPGIDWDVEDLDITEDGSLLAFTTNEDGIARLYLMDTATGRFRAVPGLALGQIGGLAFDRAGGRLAFVLNTAQSPSDVFVLEIGSGAIARWTHSEVGGLETSTFVQPELIRWPTFDQVEGRPRLISGFLYRPAGPGPHPVVIDIHGGPEAQSRPGFNPRIQYWVRELGVAVILPNVRGSSGYGKSFLQLDNGVLREDSVKDVGTLLDWVAREPALDARRVAVYGGSYGGYMVYASLAHFNDRLAAGVSIVGISNFITFLNNTEAYRRDLRRVEYGDERDPAVRAVLERISPTAQAARITRPMLIAHGMNDPRVPFSEAEQMRDRIRGQGGAVWFFAARDEGHGFAKKQNRDVFEQSVVLFFEQHLLPAR